MARPNTKATKRCDARSVPLLPSRSLLLGAAGFCRLRLAVAHLTSEFVPLDDAGPVRLGSVTVHGARFPVVWRGENPVGGAWVPLLVALTGDCGFGRGRLGLEWGSAVPPGQAERLWAWLSYGNCEKDWDPARHLSNWGTVTSGVPPEDLVSPVTLTTALHPLFVRMQSQEPLVRATHLPALTGMDGSIAMGLPSELAFAFSAVPPQFRKATTTLTALPRQRLPIRYAGLGAVTGASVRAIVHDVLCRPQPAAWVSELLPQITPGLQATCEMFWECVSRHGGTLGHPNRDQDQDPDPADQAFEILVACTVTTLRTMAPGMLTLVPDGDVHATDAGACTAVVAQVAIIATGLAARPIVGGWHKEKARAVRTVLDEVGRRAAALLDTADKLSSTLRPADSIDASPATGSASEPAPRTTRATAAADRLVGELLRARPGADGPER